MTATKAKPARRAKKQPALEVDLNFHDGIDDATAKDLAAAIRSVLTARGIACPKLYQIDIVEKDGSRRPAFVGSNRDGAKAFKDCFNAGSRGRLPQAEIAAVS